MGHLMVTWERPNSLEPTSCASGESSLYERWSRFCLTFCPDSREVRQMLGTLSGINKILDAASDYSKRPARYETVIAALTASNDDFWHASGVDIFGRDPHALSASAYLRYCPHCLAHGFHATLFQHLLTCECPLHHCRLELTCTSCGLPLAPTWEQAARFPYACPHCSALLIKTTTRVDRGEKIQRVESVIGESRTALKECGDETSLPQPPATLNPFTSAWFQNEARTRRYLRRHLQWRGSEEGRQSLKSEVSVTSLEASPPAPWRSIQNGMTSTILDTLARLRALSVTDQSQIPHAVSILDVRGSGLRIQAAMKAVVAAYCKTAILYGVPPAVGVPSRTCNPALSGIWFQTQFLPVRSRLIPGPVAMNQILAECEVLGLFCMVLSSLVLLDRTVLIDWGDCPSFDQFCPAWRWLPTERVLQIRPRATWSLVTWMIERYADRELHE